MLAQQVVQRPFTEEQRKAWVKMEKEITQENRAEVLELREIKRDYLAALAKEMWEGMLDLMLAKRLDYVSEVHQVARDTPDELERHPSMYLAVNGVDIREIVKGEHTPREKSSTSRYRRFLCEGCLCHCSKDNHTKWHSTPMKHRSPCHSLSESLKASRNAQRESRLSILQGSISDRDREGGNP